MDIKTLHYSGAYFTDYAKERAQVISEGWELLDENLLKYERGQGLFYVRGSVVFKKPAQ